MLKFKAFKFFTFSFLVILVNSSFAQNIVTGSDGNKKVITLKTNSGIQAIYPSSGLSSPGKLPQSTVKNENTSGLNWNLYFSAPGYVFKDVSFVNAQVGYIVTELGAVFKTTNGGVNWVTKLNLGFPYYWYGVYALSPDTLIISGFNNQGNIFSGVVRWSYNGGTTWTPDITLYITGGVGWLDKVHFYDQNTGVVFAGFSGAIHYTTNGGRDSASWNYVQVNSDLAWFSGNYDFQNSGNIFATGIHFAHSTNFGVSWSTFPSADNVFDGGVDFLDDNNNYGWTGGGQISSPVSGWVHRTTDGGTSWSERLNTFAYPIRSVKFFNQNSGIICGGNLYDEAGGIYSTTDGGSTWNPDVSTSAEMFSMNQVNVSQDSIDIWCVGSTGSSTGFRGKAYKTRIRSAPTEVSNLTQQIPDDYILNQNFPNPFNPVTRISYRTSVSSLISVKIYDAIGNEVETLVNEKQSAGTYSFNWSANNFPSGIYFCKMKAGNFTDVIKMILLK